MARIRRLPVFIILAGVAQLSRAAKMPVTQTVTVAQLVQFVSTNQRLRDGKLAVQIADMKLAERLSDADEGRLAGELPGKKSKLALLAIADESAFLDPPAAEIPNLPPPDRATQTALINRTIEYAIHSMKALPNFTATRTTVWFAGTPTVVSPEVRHVIFEQSLTPPQGNERLAGTGTTTARVVYRGGHEEYDHDRKAENEELNHQCGSNTWGEFGEVLGRAALAATQGTIVWSHWENGTSGLLAVYRYAADFKYKIPIMCLYQADLPPVLIDARGELAVNPADGTVLRVTEMWRWKSDPDGWGNIQDEWDTMVEYGSVEIGERAYLCPVKSTNVRVNPFQQPRAWLNHFDHTYHLTEDPLREWVDDITFGSYHVFRAETKILTGESPQPTPPSEVYSANPKPDPSAKTPQ